MGRLRREHPEDPWEDLKGTVDVCRVVLMLTLFGDPTTECLANSDLNRAFAQTPAPLQCNALYDHFT